MPDTLSRIRERHRYVEGHNADGDERTGCVCGKLWQCDAADLLAHIDALTAASRAVIDGYEERGLIHDVDCEDLTDKVYALRALIP